MYTGTSFNFRLFDRQSPTNLKYFILSCAQKKSITGHSKTKLIN